MIGPEFRLHCAVATWLTVCLKPPAWWTTIEHGVRLPKATWARLQRVGVRAGIPDILVVHDGRCFWIELKAAGNYATEPQRLAHERLRAAGSPVAVCRSTDDVRANLAAWGVPMRERSDARAARQQEMTL